MKPRHKVVNKKWFTNKLQHSACIGLALAFIGKYVGRHACRQTDL